ncbi:mCG147770 [Mus musculus]|nr:mCG147770 [Mus musculus]
MFSATFKFLLCQKSASENVKLLKLCIYFQKELTMVLEIGIQVYGNK